MQTVGHSQEKTQETADALVHQHTNALVHQVTQSPKTRGTVARKRGPSVARIVAYLETPLGNQLLVKCASERRTISECVAEAVQQWLALANNT